MSSLQIRIPGQAPRTLGAEEALLTVGRSSQNDLIIEDPSLSRLHARFLMKGDQAFVEDLGSLNGTAVNGQRVRGLAPVQAGDEVTFGTVLLTLAPLAAPKVFIDPQGKESLARATLVMSAEKLRSTVVGGTDKVQGRWLQVLHLIQELTLQLIRDVPPQQLLEDLVERLFAFLQPDRGVVLLRGEGGQVEPVVVRTQEGNASRGQIRLSHTLVEAALERREALLLNDPISSPDLASQSLIFSGVSTIIVTPLEAEGQVIGLLYFDATPHRSPFSEDDLLLVTALAHVAAAKIQNAKLMGEVQKKRALEQEMAIARSIQQRLLPGRPPALEGLELHGSNQASRQVSGDLYGFWPLPDGGAYVVIADVSGKGIGPGLLMATFQAYMSAWAELALDPAPLAERLSAALAHHTTTNRFVTGFLMRLRPGGAFTWTSAGHNPALLLRATGAMEALPTGGMPLAMLPGTVPYAEAEGSLGPGDLLCLYTDGITEAENPEGEEFGQEGLAACLRGHREGGLEDLDRALHEALDAFTGHAPPSDDRTLVLLRRIP